MLDVYVQGKAERVSPEAPVLVLRHEQERAMAGGAANVALNVAALGGEALLVGVVGAGEEATNGRLRGLLSAAGVSAAGVLEEQGRCTTVKMRFLAQGQHLLRYDREDVADIAAQTDADLRALVREYLSVGVDAMILQDYNKGVLNAQRIAACIEAAQAAGVPVIVDPKQANFFAYLGCTLFKPNLREATQALGREVRGDDEAGLYGLAAEIAAKLLCRYVCITLGERGAYLYERATGQGRRLAPLKKRHAVDICGAGDTVVSALAMALAQNWSIEEAVHWANLAGGQVCERIGVVSADAEQLAQEWKAAKEAL